MIYVGIDIGKPRHCAAAIDEQGQIVLKPIVVMQDSAGLEALDQRLRALGGRAEVRIAVEASGHYWKLLWQFLLERGWRVEVLNPVLSAATARRHLRGRKSDADDAIFIAKTLRDGGFHPLVVGDVQTEQIKTLCRQRSWTVSLLCNAKRRLVGVLDRVFPEFAAQFGNPFGRAALALLKTAPNAKRCAALHLKRLTHLLCAESQNYFGADKARSLRTVARKSLAAKYDDEALASSVRLLVAQIEFLQAQVAQLDAEIAGQFDALDHPIKTIPGIGRVTAPVIIAEIGDINRFVGPRGAHRILAYAGLEPRVRESGQWKGRPKMSKRGSPILRTALFQAASMVRMHHPFFAAIYDRHRKDKQKHHSTAISHVARKLVEIIYAVCKSNQPFDPARLCPASA
jgi:transposase